MIRSKSYFNRYFIALAITLLFAGCARKPGEDDAQATVKPVVPVRAAQVTRGNVEEVLSATGRTEAVRKEKLTASISGRITKLSVLEGASVQQGDVIAIITTKDAQAAIDGAHVLLNQAKSPEEKAKAKEVLRVAESTSNGVTVRANLTGIVSSRVANEGEFVQEGQELLTIIDPTSVQFVADIPPAEMAAVRIGEAARVWLPGGANEKLAAVVASIKPQADKESQAAQVVLRFGKIPAAYERLLRTDVQGTVEIIIGSHGSAFLVPTQALLRNDENNSFNIVTFGADSLTRSVLVDRGSTSDGHTEIRNLPDAPESIKEGMNVITDGNYALPDSTRITLIH